MSSGIPGLAQVRESYVYAQLHVRGHSTTEIGSVFGAEFDRWLEAHDRQVAERAFRSAADWARACSSESADVAAAFIEDVAAAFIEEQAAIRAQLTTEEETDD